jgi:SAM-dependent methyltransferase
MPFDTGNSFSKQDWSRYYARKRVLHQWTQVDLLNTVPGRRVLEIGPGMGLVTAMLRNAGYEVETLDNRPRAFAQPDVRHIERDLRQISGGDIAGYDAILCCETLEHIEWPAVGPILAELRRSGAPHLLVSVPYMGLQLTVELYANRHVFRQYFSLKKWLAHKRFHPEPPGGHQWEVGYKGYALPVWERCLREAGWTIRSRVFTEYCRSVFHLLDAGRDGQ